MKKLLNLSDKTKSTLAKLSPESQEKVLKAAGSLVQKKAEEMLKVKAKLTNAIKSLE